MLSAHHYQVRTCNVYNLFYLSSATSLLAPNVSVQQFSRLRYYDSLLYPTVFSLHLEK